MRWRTATPDDALLLAQLNHQLIAHEGHSNPMDVPALRERMLRFLSTEYRAVLFLEDDATVAYALFREDETGSIHLRHFFVLAERRRQGIGRKAIQLFRDDIVPSGKRIMLEVLSTNSVGLAFWNATGFTEYSVTFESKPTVPRVRRLEPSEWRTYRELRLQSLRESPDAFGRTFAEEEHRSDSEWEARLRASGELDLPLLATVNDELAGLAWGKVDASSPNDVHVFQMWVMPAHRRIGAGRMLLDAVIAWARNAGRRRVVLGVASGDTPAVQLYTRAGFRPIGEQSPLRSGSSLLSQTMQLALDESKSD